MAMLNNQRVLESSNQPRQFPGEVTEVPVSGRWPPVARPSPPTQRAQRARSATVSPVAVANCKTVNGMYIWDMNT